MKNYLRALFIFVLLCIFTVPCAQAREPALESRDIAPDFKLQDLNQGTFSLSSYKDKQAVILFFWTTWCPFCRDELRMLRDTYPELVKEGWELFAVNVGESTYKVEKFVKEKALDFAVLLDKDTTVAYSYGILGVPTYIIVDKQGLIVFKDNYFPKGRYKELVPE
jgi:peroxiredoxin